MKLIEWRREGYNYILTVEEGWLFKKTKQYIGSSTVWRSFPDFQRQGVFTESRLSDICSMIKYQECNLK